MNISFKAEQHLMLRDLLSRDSAVYRQFPDIKQRNLREYAETSAFFDQNPELLRAYIAKQTPTFMRRRYDYPAYQVKIQQKGHKYSKDFRDQDYGGREQALKAAQMYIKFLLRKIERRNDDANSNRKVQNFRKRTPGLVSTGSRVSNFQTSRGDESLCRKAA